MKKQTVMVYLKRGKKLCFLVRDKKNDTVHKQGILLSIGGKVEAGEGIVEAAKREVMEESGVTIHSASLRAVMYFRDFGTERHDWNNYLFICEDFSGEPVAGNEGSFTWEDISDLNKLNVYPQDKVYLNLLKQHRFFVAEFLCEGHEMVAYSVLQAL